MMTNSIKNPMLALGSGLVGGLLGALAIGGFGPSVDATGAASLQPVAITPLTADNESVADLSLEKRLDALETQLAGLRSLKQAQPGTVNAVGDLVRKGLTAPVAEAEVLRFLEIERAVARFRSLRQRQQRARDSVEQSLADAKLPAAKRRIIDSIVRDYFNQERAILMTDRNRLVDSGREALEQAHRDLARRTAALLCGQLEPGAAQAVADQLAHGGGGRSFANAKGFRSIRPGEIKFPSGVGPFRK